MRIRHIAAATTLAALTTAGLISVTATPATATAADCIAYLNSVQQQSSVRDGFCISTQTFAEEIGDEVALAECSALMTVTLLPPHHTAQACQRAVQD
jgi:hypothetical protein